MCTKWADINDPSIRIASAEQTIACLKAAIADLQKENVALRLASPKETECIPPALITVVGDITPDEVGEISSEWGRYENMAACDEGTVLGYHYLLAKLSNLKATPAVDSIAVPRVTLERILASKDPVFDKTLLQNVLRAVDSDLYGRNTACDLAVEKTVL